MRRASCKRLTDNRTSPRKFQTKLRAHPGKRKDSLDRNNLRVRRNPGEKRCPTASSVQGKPADLLVASRGRFFRLACRANIVENRRWGKGHTEILEDTGKHAKDESVFPTSVMLQYEYGQVREGPESRGSAGRKQTIAPPKNAMPGWTRRQFLKGLSLAGSGCLAKYQSIVFLPHLGSVAPAGFAQSALKQLFEEVPSAASGLIWRHENGRSPDYFLPETTGAGCAFLDYDNDGWMDIYLVNGGKCDFLVPDPPLRNALYRNNRNGTFIDVTERAGLAAPGWASSAVWFDYDNDGRLDLFVCRFVDF